MEAALAAYNQSLCSKDRFTFIGGDLLSDRLSGKCQTRKSRDQDASVVIRSE
jgi:hypothetical protein